MCLVQEKFGSDLSGGKDSHKIIDVETSVALPHSGGGSRAGLFRTPISGGVQSATSAHGLPRPALAVRNLMEQVKKGYDHHSQLFLFERLMKEIC